MSAVTYRRCPHCHEHRTDVTRRRGERQPCGDCQRTVASVRSRHDYGRIGRTENVGRPELPHDYCNRLWADVDAVMSQL